MHAGRRNRLRTVVVVAMTLGLMIVVLALALLAWGARSRGQYMDVIPAWVTMHAEEEQAPCAPAGAHATALAPAVLCPHVRPVDAACPRFLHFPLSRNGVLAHRVSEVLLGWEAAAALNLTYVANSVDEFASPDTAADGGWSWWAHSLLGIEAGETVTAAELAVRYHATAVDVCPYEQAATGALAALCNVVFRVQGKCAAVESNPSAALERGKACLRWKRGQGRLLATSWVNVVWQLSRDAASRRLDASFHRRLADHVEAALAGLPTRHLVLLVDGDGNDDDRTVVLATLSQLPHARILPSLSPPIALEVMELADVLISTGARSDPSKFSDIAEVAALVAADVLHFQPSPEHGATTLNDTTVVVPVLPSGDVAISASQLRERVLRRFCPVARSRRFAWSPAAAEAFLGATCAGSAAAEAVLPPLASVPDPVALALAKRNERNESWLACRTSTLDAVDLSNGAFLTDTAAPSDRHRLAVVIPYRMREPELSHLLVMLQRKLAGGSAESATDYFVVVVHQVDQHRFNRAALLNIGAVFAQHRGADYLALQDVDRFPVDANLGYGYPGDAFVHLVPPWSMRKSYPKYVGGVGVIALDTFRRIDGLATVFWGWGAEDDDMYTRLVKANVSIVRPDVPDDRKPSAVIHNHNGRDRETAGFTKRKRLVGTRLAAATGLSTLRYTVDAYRECAFIGLAPRFVMIDVRVECNVTATPWCDRGTPGRAK